MSFPIIFGGRSGRGGRGGGIRRIVADSWAEYHFHEGSGQVLTDMSGNGRHMQLGSTAGVDANDPMWSVVGGIAGLTFDSDDYTLLETNLDQPFTVLMLLRSAYDNAANAGICGQATTVCVFAMTARRLRHRYGGGSERTVGTATANTWQRVASVASGAASFGVVESDVGATADTGTGRPVIWRIGTLTNLAGLAMSVGAFVIVPRAMSAGEIAAAFANIYAIKGTPA